MIAIYARFFGGSLVAAGLGLLLAVFSGLGLAAVPQGSEQAVKPGREQPQSQSETALKEDPRWRVSGKFQVSEVKEVASGKGAQALRLMKISFTELELGEKNKKGPGSKPPKQLFLLSRLGHPRLHLGAQVDMVAMGRGEQKGASLEALQILIFVEQGQRQLPVWILSERQKKLDLRGISFFKMHSPDFVIL